MEDEIEIWKDIPRFKGYYQISTFGNMRSVDRVVSRKHLHSNKIKGQLIRYYTNRDGYIYVSVSFNAKMMMVFPKREVAIAFIPNPENKPEVNIIDGNKRNLHYKNLEWNTKKENVQHSMRTGLNGGEKHPSAKLKEKQVLDIRRRYSGKYGEYSELAREYGVCSNNIKDIVKGETWKYI